MVIGRRDLAFMKSTKKDHHYHPPSAKNISTATPFREDIINVWCPSSTKKLILSTLKRDTSVENPMCSHPMVCLCNKDPVQILPIQLLSNQKFHIDQQT